MCQVKDHVKLIFNDGEDYDQGTRELQGIINHLHNIDTLKFKSHHPASTYLLCAMRDYLKVEQKNFQEWENSQKI